MIPSPENVDAEFDWDHLRCLIRCYSGQATNHQMDHRHLDDGYTGCRQQFVILTQASGAIEPGEGAFDVSTTLRSSRHFW